MCRALRIDSAGRPHQRLTGSPGPACAAAPGSLQPHCPAAGRRKFQPGELQGSHDPSGVVFTVLAALSGMEREYIRDRTLEGHESARARGKSIGGAAVTDEAMLAVALHLRGQERSLRDIAARLVIATGRKKGQHPSPATVMRMLREHDEKTPATSVVAWSSADSCPVPGHSYRSSWLTRQDEKLPCGSP